MDSRLHSLKHIALLLTLALLLSSSSSLAETTPSSSVDNKVIRISAGEWPPFIGQNLQNHGFVAQVVTQAFAYQGYQVEFYFLPWKRAYNEAVQGKFDATAIWMFDEARTEHFHYSEPVSREEFVFFHHVDNQFDWKTLSDIKGKHLGGGLGYSYGDELNQLIEDKQVTMSRVNEPKQNLLRLSHKRIDLYPEEVHIGYYVLKQQPELEGQITHHPVAFLTNHNYLLIPKSHPNSEKILAEFNQGLSKWKLEHTNNTVK